MEDDKFLQNIARTHHKMPLVVQTLETRPTEEAIKIMNKVTNDVNKNQAGFSKVIKELKNPTDRRDIKKVSIQAIFQLDPNTAFYE
jgi:hypothetical protein